MNQLTHEELTLLLKVLNQIDYLVEVYPAAAPLLEKLEAMKKEAT